MRYLVTFTGRRSEIIKATDELCAKGIAKGCYQNTSALLAAVDLLTAGDIEVEKMLAVIRELL